ncbi:host-nuclease inhibitor Gam family protein [Patescibacteria group bacterium]
MTKKTLKRSVVAVPQDLAAAAKFIADIAVEQRAIDAVNTRLNSRLDRLKEEAAEKVQVRQRRIDDLVTGLFAFAQANRTELTDSDKKKSVDLPVGTFGWRLTPPAVTLRNVDAVLKQLREKRLTRFIRVKKTVDKEAMLKEPGAAGQVKGVKIGQHEEFFVKPDKTDAEIAAGVDKLKKLT